MQKIVLRSSSYQMNNQHSREVWVEVYRRAVQTLTPRVGWGCVAGTLEPWNP